MSATYKDFPQFDGISGSVMARLILEARLSPQDVQIATQKLIWEMDYVDIGAGIGMDRSGVGWRMTNKIVPRIELILGYYTDAPYGKQCVNM